MKIEKITTKGTWREVADSARTTIGLGEGIKEPTTSWKKRMLLAEHSPIRKLQFCWKWKDLKYWVSVHLVRHWLGIVHFVRTQRTDRTGVPRDELPQSALVIHEAEANAQALIFISRKRLCYEASVDTRKAWEAVKAKVAETDPVVASVMVKECIYRGFCPEVMPKCRYVKTKGFVKELEDYRNVGK